MCCAYCTLDACVGAGEGVEGCVVTHLCISPPERPPQQECCDLLLGTIPHLPNK